MGTGPSLGPITPQGVLTDFRRLRSQIGKSVQKTPGIQPRALAQEQDPQFQRSVSNSKWARALKKKVAETRQTSRPVPERDSAPAIRPRPANQRPNTGATRQIYPQYRDSRQWGHDAGGGPK